MQAVSLVSVESVGLARERPLETRPRSAFGQARVPMGASHRRRSRGNLRCALFLHGGDDAQRLALQPAGDPTQKSIAGAQRAPDLDASDAFAGFSAYLGFRASFWPLGKDKLSLIGEKAMFSRFA